MVECACGLSTLTAECYAPVRCTAQLFALALMANLGCFQCGAVMNRAATTLLFLVHARVSAGVHLEVESLARGSTYILLPSMLPVFLSGCTNACGRVLIRFAVEEADAFPLFFNSL